MGSTALPHCGEDHGRVLEKLASHDEKFGVIDKRLDAHNEWLRKIAAAFGDHCGARELHVTQPQLQQLIDVVDEGQRRQDASVNEIKAAVAKIDTERQVEKAGMTRHDKLFMVLLNAGVGVLVAVLALYGGK